MWKNFWKLVKFWSKAEKFWKTGEILSKWRGNCEQVGRNIYWKMWKNFEKGVKFSSIEKILNKLWEHLSENVTEF